MKNKYTEQQRKIRINSLEQAIETTLDKAKDAHIAKRGYYINKIVEYSREYLELTGRLYVVKNYSLDND